MSLKIEIMANCNLGGSWRPLLIKPMHCRVRPKADGQTNADDKKGCVETNPTNISIERLTHGYKLTIGVVSLAVTSDQELSSLITNYVNERVEIEVELLKKKL